MSQKMCSRVATFEVKATLMGDLNEWMTITLDDEHASTADVKAGVEQVKGTRPAVQELFRYDESWTATKGSGGSGHAAMAGHAAHAGHLARGAEPALRAGTGGGMGWRLSLPTQQQVVMSRTTLRLTVRGLALQLNR
jgi:hypothetical protein